MSEEEFNWPWKSLAIALIAGLALFSSMDDVASVEFKDSGNVVVERGECRILGNGTFCYDTWEILGFDTGLFPVAYVRGETGMSRLELYRYVFVRESDFLPEKRSWPEGSRIHSGNYSGEIPDYNVSLVEGVGVE